MQDKKPKYGFLKWLFLAIAGFYFYKKRSNKKQLKVVDNVDLEKYSGKWFEIGSIPEKHQKGCSNTIAEYSVTEEGYVKVVNSCNKDIIEETRDKAEGKAYPVKNSNNAKLKIEFQWPFKGDYWIMALGENYEYAMVGNPDRKYLWILSRTNELKSEIYDSLLKKAEDQGYDISKVKKTEHYKSKKTVLSGKK